MATAPLHSTTLPPLAEGPPAPSVGDMLGNYRLEAVAGEGGMGRVFMATHTKLDKRVAIKVLRRRYSRRPEAIARFFQEARAVNVIRHPNIVEITDFFEGPTGGDSYYIMEWLDGMTLGARLQGERVLPVEIVVAIGRQIASALAAVHKAGFVHRDLKPDNIFICHQLGQPGRINAKILDFGVAMLQGGPSDGAVAGTPAYFSPEGAAGRALDGRSDIYSLGVMLYELLSGAPPFQASSLSEYVMKHMTVKPRPLSEVALHLPPLLVQIVERCLEKSPEQRFQTMDEVEAALASIEVQVTPPPPPLPSPLRFSRLALMALGVMVASAAMTRVVRAVRAPATDESAAITTGTAPVAADPQPPIAIPAPNIPNKAKMISRPAEDSQVEVILKSQPLGAEVYRDGTLLGVTPCTVRLPPGRQLLDLFRPGARRTSLEVDARRGAVYNVKLALEAPDARTSGAPAAPGKPSGNSLGKSPATPKAPGNLKAPAAPVHRTPATRPARAPSRSSTINPFD